MRLLARFLVSLVSNGTCYDAWVWHGVIEVATTGPATVISAHTEASQVVDVPVAIVLLWHQHSVARQLIGCHYDPSTQLQISSD